MEIDDAILSECSAIEAVKVRIGTFLTIFRLFLKRYKSFVLKWHWYDSTLICIQTS